MELLRYEHVPEPVNAHILVADRIKMVDPTITELEMHRLEALWSPSSTQTQIDSILLLLGLAIV